VSASIGSFGFHRRTGDRRHAVRRMILRRPDSVAVLGGGIVGLAVARQLGLRFPGLSVTVIEKESRVAAHQSGHNSGVVHAGVYYEPKSLKATLCRRGGALLREFCQEHRLPYRELGKLIIASSTSQLEGLATIEERAHLNGVPGITRLGPRGITDVEPFAVGVAALHSPSTAAVDYVAICRALVGEIEQLGGQVLLGHAVVGVAESGRGVSVSTRTERRQFDQVVICAGLQGDQLARLAGQPADLRIIPFRGEYFALRPEARHRVRGMVYPVPDPRYPFLGVHLTRDVSDGVHVGPNAVLALALEGYRRRDVRPSDLLRIASWPGTWRLVAQHWRFGMGELASSLSTRRYLKAVQAYLPALELDDLERSVAGVRAQAVDRQGRLVDDFVLQNSGRIFSVRNAPSPAATSSLAIAEYVVSALAEGL
jgi:(S)-2-hydroxyglutarate dehydrogenase